MSSAVKRSVLRWMHLVFSIPVLGYVYGPIAEVQPYAAAVRFIFVPVMVLSGFWMYAGVVFAVIGVAAWIAAYLLSGSGTAILGQVVLFLGWRVWSAIRERRGGAGSSR